MQVPSSTTGCAGGWLGRWWMSCKQARKRASQTASKNKARKSHLVRADEVGSREAHLAGGAGRQPRIGRCTGCCIAWNRHFTAPPQHLRHIILYCLPRRIQPPSGSSPPTTQTPTTCPNRHLLTTHLQIHLPSTQEEHVRLQTRNPAAGGVAAVLKKEILHLWAWAEGTGAVQARGRTLPAAVLLLLCCHCTAQVATEDGHACQPGLMAQLPAASMPDQAPTTLHQAPSEVPTHPPTHPPVAQDDRHARLDSNGRHAVVLETGQLVCDAAAVGLRGGKGGRHADLRRAATSTHLPNHPPTHQTQTSM